MNKINTYGYAVYHSHRAHAALHIVAIFSEMHVAFEVFDNARNAKQFILENCSGITYNSEFDFLADFSNLLQLYIDTDPTHFFKKSDGRVFIRGRIH